MQCTISNQFQICKINRSFLTINPYLRYQVSILKITKSGKNICIGTINTCFIQLSSITDFLHRYNIYRGTVFSGIFTHLSELNK